MPAEGASFALAIRSTVVLKLLNAFSHDASLPPLGPMMNPRYSEAARMLKVAHLGQCLARYSRGEWFAEWD